jgi:hypothetical protein
MLSCRSSGAGTKSYQRRLSSADLVQEMTSGDRHRNLPPLPIVPYAVSLSLTAAYRAIRDCQKEPHIAYQDLITRCTILESLSHRWWSAGRMAKLGRMALSRLKSPNFAIQSAHSRGVGPRTRTVNSQLDRQRRPSREQVETAADEIENGDATQSIHNNARNSKEPSQHSHSQIAPIRPTTSVGAEADGRMVHADFPYQLRVPELSAGDMYKLTHLDNIFDDLFDFGLPAMNQNEDFWGISPPDGLS